MNDSRLPAPENLIGEGILKAFDHIADRAQVRDTISTSQPDGYEFTHAEWYRSLFPSNIIISTRMLPLLMSSFSVREMEIAVDKLKPKAASGPDLISNAMIKHLTPKSINIIRNVFNLLYYKGKYPVTWREFYVIFIPKNDGGSFRPISLASSLLKLFESLIKGRMEWVIEKCRLFSDVQFGFRRGLSCTDSLYSLCRCRTPYFIERLVGAVFLDIMGAFDNVLPDTLLRILRGFRFPAKLVRFIKFIISQRIVEGYAGTSFGKRTASKGLPQGSVLSPALFELYLAALIRGIDPEVKVLVYADDLCIYAADCNLSSLISKLNRTLNFLSSKLRIGGLELSPCKSMFCIFSNHRPSTIHKRLKKNNLVLSINDQPIDLSYSVRFLGVVLDANLRWRGAAEIRQSEGFT